MIYLDNAATTIRKPESVVRAVAEALGSMGNAGRGAHDAALFAARRIYEVRAELTALFGGTDPSCLVFTANSTESLNMAIKGLLRPGDHVITTELEHNSVLRPLYQMEDCGAELTIIKSDRLGRLRCEDFEKAARPNTKAIVCTHGSNVTGNLVDIAEVGRIAAKHGIRLIVDASQTAGIFPIDAETLGIDILCFTGHKGLLGPQGTGGMYVREGVELSPLLTGGSGVQSYSRSHPAQMPAALEAGTLNGHGLAGLGAAVRYLRETGISVIRQKEQELMRAFYRGVKDIPGVTVYGDFSVEERCPVVSLNIGGHDSSAVSDALFEDYGISTRPGAHCAPLMHRALGTEKQGAVRFSFSHYNTMEEVKRAVEAVGELAG